MNRPDNIFRGNSKISIYILQTILIVTALFIEIEIAVDDGSSSALFVFMAKFRDNFTAGNALQLSCGAGIFSLFYFYEKIYDRSQYWQITALSGIFAFLYVVCLSFKTLGGNGFLLSNGYQLFISSLCICGYWLFFRLILNWAYILFQQTKLIDNSSLNFTKAYLFSFFLIFLAWLPWLSISYPTNICTDSYWQLRQYFGLSPWTTHHPPLSSAIMGLCVSLGELIKNRNFGAFIYVFLQTFTGAAIFAAVLIQLLKTGCGKKVYTAALVFYTLNPIWGSFAQWFEKDFLYVQAFTLCMVIVLNIIQTGKCSKAAAVSLCIVAVLAILLRNNGKYELLPMLIIFCFFLRGVDRKRFVCTVCTLFVVSSSVTGFLYPHLGVQKGSSAEMLSIPFQQTARYVKYYGDDVSDQEEEAIRAVLAYDTLAEDYMPGSSDPVKAKYSGNDSALKDYFKAWLQMGLRHPMVYIDAFIHQAYGYLAPVQTSREPIITYDGLKEYVDIEISTNDNFFPTIFFETCYTIFGRLPFLNLIITSGAYTWMCMLCAVFLIIRKKYTSTVFFVPAFMNVLVCLASPQNSSIRYSLQIIAVAPLLLWWTALSLSRGSTSKESPLPE